MKFILKGYSYFDTSLSIFLQKLFHFIMTRSQARCTSKDWNTQCIISSNCQFAYLRGRGVIVPLAPSPHATASPLPHMGGYFLMDSNLTILVCRQKKEVFYGLLKINFCQNIWMDEWELVLFIVLNAALTRVHR